MTLCRQRKKELRKLKPPGPGEYQHAKHNLEKTFKSHMGKTGLKISLGKAIEMNGYLCKCQLKGKIKNHERVHLGVVPGRHPQSYEICLVVRCALLKNKNRNDIGNPIIEKHQVMLCSRFPRN